MPYGLQGPERSPKALWTSLCGAQKHLLLFVPELLLQSQCEPQSTLQGDVSLAANPQGWWKDHGLVSRAASVLESRGPIGPRGRGSLRRRPTGSRFLRSGFQTTRQMITCCVVRVCVHVRVCVRVCTCARVCVRVCVRVCDVPSAKFPCGMGKTRYDVLRAPPFNWDITHTTRLQHSLFNLAGINPELLGWNPSDM